MDKQGYNIFLLTFFKSERFLKASLLQKKKNAKGKQIG